MAGTKRPLKIPTPGRAIEIEDFAGKVQAWRESPFQCLRVNMLQGDAARGDHAFGKSAGVADGQGEGGKVENQPLLLADR